MALSTSCVQLPEIKNKCMYDNICRAKNFCDDYAYEECWSQACHNIVYSKCLKNLLNRMCVKKSWE